MLALGLVLLFAAIACTNSGSATDRDLNNAIVMVREHLADTYVEGDNSNPRCLFLVERDGPRSVEWVAEDAENGTITVEAHKGGVPVRGFSWSYDRKSHDVTSSPTSTSTLC